MASSPASRVSSPRYRIATDEILDAATAAFADEGFDRATMECIAARAGVSKPTLYARFGDKERLFQAAVEREYAIRKVRLFNAYEGGDGEPFHQRLHRWSSAYFDLVRERPDAFVLISDGERHRGAAAIVRRGNEEIVERIAQLVVEVSGHRAERGAHLVASMISGIFTACARDVVLTGGIDIADASALCESFLYAALRGLDARLIEAAG